MNFLKLKPDTVTQADTKKLQTEVSYLTKLNNILDRIHAADDLDEILINLKDDITSLFEAERLTVYAVDGIKREIFSRFKSGNEINEIRVPIAPLSISGYVAFKERLVNIKNVYDSKELEKIDPQLKFDSSWDKKTGFQTKQVLAVPIMFSKLVLGVIQLINRKDGTSFSEQDEDFVQKLGKTLGIAFYNKKKMQKHVKSTKLDYLLENHLITRKEVERATADARAKNVRVDEILMKEYKISKEEIGKSFAQYYNVKYQPFYEKIPIPGELLTNMKPTFMKQNVWVPLRREDNGKIFIVTDDPYDLYKIDGIKSAFNNKKLEFSFCFSFKEDILKFINLFFPDTQLPEGDAKDIVSQLDSEADLDVEEEEIDEESSKIVALVNQIIRDAYRRKASDIHIEPYPGKEPTQVRIRIDGACTNYLSIPHTYRNAVVSRLKIMSDLDISERRKPQDGKLQFKKFGGVDIELRIATVPTAGGLEDIVMRILAAGKPLPLDNMGFLKHNYENFVSAITKPYGIIFVCGPTGSGKTTTLHSALGYINKEETKIWTAEDPVEITQKGLRQVQVQSKIGFTFAAAMRAFLRADPDVIMVGEMRDKETTSIGIEASLTGHLVFSTLHTNSAPETVTRLLDMGMDPFNFADAVLCILAQRLMRTLCKDCKEQFHPTQEEYDDLVREFGDKTVFERLIGLGITKPYSKDLIMYKAKGCDACNKSGYRGRMGIHELLMGTKPAKKLIQTGARMEEIKDQSIKDGMTTLKQDGISKIFMGSCDIDQVRKVCIS
ncbi:MAG: GspE/PulE family protein [Desulfobacterales bacterium]|nr:GspE/PulE family protein [Desulfobacterales bacterium]